MSQRFIAGFLTSKHRIVKYVRILLKLFFFASLRYFECLEVIYCIFSIKFVDSKEITSFDIQLGNFVFDCEKNDKILSYIDCI